MLIKLCYCDARRGRRRTAGQERGRQEGRQDTAGKMNQENRGQEKCLVRFIETTATILREDRL